MGSLHAMEEKNAIISLSRESNHISSVLQFLAYHYTNHAPFFFKYMLK